MKTCSIAIGLAAVTFSMNVLMALDLPGDIPEGAGWDTWWDKTTRATCTGQTWETYALDTGAARDFTAAEKATERASFEGMYACTYRGEATYTYNCHAYVFGGSGYWGGDPANWLGAAAPCYQVDATGPVYRWGGSHSANAGTDHTYLGKCGASIRCDHGNAVYGAHTDRWRVRVAS